LTRARWGTPGLSLRRPASDGPQPVVVGGGRRGRGRDPRASGYAVRRRGQTRGVWPPSSDRARLPGRRSLQRPGAPSRQHVPEGVRVGTVDKFQGQEAPVVIVSMASSSAEDAPRGIGLRGAGACL